MPRFRSSIMSRRSALFRPRRFLGRNSKKPNNSFIETSGEIALAAATAANYSLIISSDAPTKSIVTNLSTTIAQCENNTKILRGSFIKLNMIASTVPVIVGLWVWVNMKGYVTTATNSFDFNLGPAIEDNVQLRRHTIYYRRLPITPQVAREIIIPLGRRRNNFIPDATDVKLLIHNTSATGAISFAGYGRIKTLEG